jgi:predicted phosphodiesterase
MGYIVKKYSFVLILLVFILIGKSYSKVIQPPYLSSPNSLNNSVIVLVETSDDKPVIIGLELQNKVSFDTSNFYIKTLASPKTFVHRVVLKDLKPNEKYTYWLQNDKGKKEYPSFFYSPSAVSTSFTFGIMGDCRTGVKIHNQIAESLFKFKPHFLVYTGDLCFDGTYKGWKDEFFVPNELQLLAITPFINAVGNHEGWRQNTQAFQQSTDIDKNSPYFDFDYGDIHFVVINTEDNFSKGSEQYDFIKKSLEVTKKKFKIVVSHIPGYAGSGGGHGENKKLIELSKDLFVPNKVDIMISGHIHTYQHNLVDGIHYLIIGGGGAPLYTTSPGKYTIKNDKIYNFAIGDYKNGKLTIKVYDNKGNEIDKIEIEKN